MYRWHLSRAHAMRGQHGGSSLWVGSNTDIHEEKETAEKLHQITEDLKYFAYAASHDLQEPLRMVTTYMQLLSREYYDRMQEKEKQLKAEVKQLLAQAEAADAAEDQEYGKDRRGDELPAELQRRETRIKKIQEAKRAVEQRARAKAAAEGADPKQARPKDKDQNNFTDPQSRIMKGADGIVQAYNAQAAVEPKLQLIVGQTVTQAANDKEQLMPMLATMEEQSGQRPDDVLADSGYCSEKNLEALDSEENPQRRIDGYIATERQKHDEYKEPCPKGPLPKGATRVDRMRRKLKTKAGKAVYAARKAIVEPVFGQIKQARGFRQFLLRGIDKVRGEWSMVCLTHNILKMYRLCYE
jgi:hypothetical protein